MRGPFDREKVEEIGLSMTPGRIRRERLQTVSSLLIANPRSSLPPRRVISGIEPMPRIEPVPAKEAPAGKRQAIRSRRPSASALKSTAPRRCVAKVDTRGYAKGQPSSSKGNRKLISSRLLPFMKPGASGGGVMNGAKVGYITRAEAMEGVLFTVNGNSLVPFSPSEAALVLGDDPTMSIILSPEDPGADMVQLARRFMREVYAPHSKADPRLWVAAIHGNTEHIHLHIIASRISKEGKDEAGLNRAYIYSGRLQKDVSRILTDIQGSRTWAEDLAAKRRKKTRLTMKRIDEEMLKAATAAESGERILELKDMGAQVKKDKASRRLQELKKAGLAWNEPGKKGIWHFRRGTAERLRRIDFEEAFGLSVEEADEMEVDIPGTEPYKGSIIESAEIRNGSQMAFMVRAEDGKIHLRRERIRSEDERNRLESLDEITLERIRGGLLAIKGLSPKGSKRR